MKVIPKRVVRTKFDIYVLLRKILMCVRYNRVFLYTSYLPSLLINIYKYCVSELFSPLKYYSSILRKSHFPYYFSQWTFFCAIYINFVFKSWSITVLLVIHFLNKVSSVKKLLTEVSFTDSFEEKQIWHQISKDITPRNSRKSISAIQGTICYIMQGKWGLLD